MEDEVWSQTVEILDYHWLQNLVLSEFRTGPGTDGLTFLPHTHNQPSNDCWTNASFLLCFYCVLFVEEKGKQKKILFAIGREYLAMHTLSFPAHVYINACSLYHLKGK